MSLLLDARSLVRYNIRAMMSSVRERSNRHLRIRRELEGFVARLHQRSGTILLVLALFLGLAEPLLCIIHCQLWRPALNGISAHAAHHNHSAAHGHGNRPTEGVTPAGNSDASNNTHCFMASGDTSGSYQPPPSPVHEGFLLLSILLVILLPLAFQSLRVFSAPPLIPHPPLAPPPREMA